jgi:multidrug transporter EmrE-like cation transporter
VSVAIGRLVFEDQIPVSTWAGLVVILVGSLIVHFRRGTQSRHGEMPVTWD